MVIISDIQLPKDSDGILKVSDVSTSAQGDLSARTDIANPATSTFVKTDAVGRLNILESNIEGAGASNSLNSTEYPVHQIGAFDGSAYRVAKCDTDGHLQVDVLSGGGGDATADNQTNGNQKSQCFGVDPSNNQVQMSVENGGKLQVQVVGSNDINGGTPHRHLTIDANGRTLTNPLMTGTNNAINNMSAKITQGENDIAAGTGAQQVLIYGKDAFAPFNLEPIRMSSDKVLMTNPNITRGEGNITGGGNGLQQILCYGKDQSGNLDPINVDSNGHLKITLNDIEAGIVNSINTIATRKNAYTQVLTNVNIALGNSTTSSAITAINGSSSTTITIYIHTGAGTTQSNFSYEVHKSYDGTHYFLDSNFSFMALGADVNANNQPAVFATYGFDAQFIRVKVNNTAEANATAINAYINERQ